MRPATWAWSLPRSNRRTSATTARSPNAATARPAGCSSRRPSISDKHPGPLGHFFRRLCRKKNRNVAVVAGAEAGHDRLADAHEERALSLRHPALDGDEAFSLAGKGHRPAARGRRAQGRQEHGEVARREPHDQGPARGVPQRGAPRAATAFGRRAAHRARGRQRSIRRRDRRAASRAATAQTSQR